MNAADLITEVLHSVGVRRIYGVVGDSLNGVTEALRQRGDIDWIHMRHEEAAAFAASAEAQLTGELAVCAGSCGPGNLHLINGLFDAHRSRTPVLAIAAHIPSAEIGRGYFQETHPESLFRECSHYCELVSHPDQRCRGVLRDGDPSRLPVTAAWRWWSSQATLRCKQCRRRGHRRALRLRFARRWSPLATAISRRWRRCSMRAPARRCSVAAAAPALTAN